MTMEEPEIFSEIINERTPSRRSFGVNLTNSVTGDIKSQKKKIRVRKSPATKATLRKHANDFRKQAASTATTSDLEYQVCFQPGPIGLKLEPVVVSGTREIGCRVMKFIDGSSTNPSQARESGKIRPGDLLIAVDGKDVISWNYPDIIAFLKQRPTSLGRHMTFRTVWQPSNQQTSQEVTLPSSKIALKKVASNSEQYQCTQANIGLCLLSPSEAAFSPMLASFCQMDYPHPTQETSKENDYQEQNDSNFISPHDASILSIAESSIGPNNTATSEIRHANNAFSPSKVKKLASTALLGQKKESLEKKPISTVLSTVYRSVVPAAGIVATSSYNVTSSLTSAVSTKLGEALVGHSSREFDQAIQLKMQLLTELSQVKVTLDAKEEEYTRLLQSIRQLSDDKASETKRLENELECQKNLADECIYKKHVELESLSQEFKFEKELLQTEIDGVKRRLKFSEARAKNLNELLDSVRHASAELGTSASEKEEEVKQQIQRLNSQIQLLTDQLSTMNARLGSKEQELESLNCKLVDQSSSLLAAVSQRNACESTVAAASKHAEIIAAELAESKKNLEITCTQKNAVEEELKTKDAELYLALAKADELRVKCRDVEMDRAETTGILCDSRQEQVHLVALVASLRTSLVKKDDEIAEMKTALLTAGLDDADMKHQLECSQAKCIAIHATSIELESSWQNATGVIKRLESDLYLSCVELEKTKETADRLRSEQEAILSNAQSNDLSRQSDFESAKNSLQSRLDFVEKERDDILVEFNQSKATLEEVTKMMKDYKERVTVIETELQDSCTAILSLTSAKNESVREVQKLKVDVSNARIGFEELEDKLRRLENDFLISSEARTILLSEKSALEVGISELRNIIKSHDRTREEKSQALVQTRLELDQVKVRNECIMARLSDAERESKCNLELARAANEEMMKIREDLDTTAAQFMELKKGAAIKDQRLLECELEIMERVDTEKAHLARMVAQEAFSAEISAEKCQIEGDWQRVRSELHEVQSRCATLEKQIQDLNETKMLNEQEMESLFTSKAALALEVSTLLTLSEEQEIQLAASAMGALKRNKVSDAKLSTSNSELLQAQSEIVSLNSINSELVKASLRVESLLQLSIEEKKTLFKTVKSLQSELSSSFQHCATVAVTLSETKASKMKLEEKLHLMSQEIETHCHAATVAEEAIKNCAASKLSQVGSLMEQVGALRSQLAAQSFLIQSSEEENHEVDIKNEQLIKDFEFDLDAMAKEMENAITANAILEGQITEQHVQLNASKAESESSETRIKELSVALEHFETDANKKGALLMEATSELDVTSVKMMDFQDAVVKLRAIVRNQEETIATLSNMVDSLQHDLHISQELRAGGEISYQDLSESHAKIRTTLAQVQEQLERKVEEYAKVIRDQKSSMQLFASYEILERKLQAAVDEKDRKAFDLLQKEAYLTKRIRDLEAKCLQQEDEIVNIRIMLLNQEVITKVPLKSRLRSSHLSSNKSRPGTMFSPHINSSVHGHRVENESAEPSLPPLATETKSCGKAEHNEQLDDHFKGKVMGIDVVGQIADGGQGQVRTAAARIMCSVMERQENVDLRTAFHQWANSATAMKAISQQTYIAHLMTEQLETTREKLARLKVHLHHAQKRSLQATGRQITRNDVI